MLYNADWYTYGFRTRPLTLARTWGVGVATAWVQGWDDPRLLGLVPIALGAIRWAEARLDQALKPLQNQHTPPSVAGGDGKVLP